MFDKRWAIGGVVAAVVATAGGLTIWLSGGAEPTPQNVAPVGAEVSTPATTTTTESVVATPSGVEATQPPAVNGVPTTAVKSGQKAPAQVQATNEPDPATTTAPPAPPVTTTTLGPGQSSAMPPDPQCRMVYDDPERYPNGRVVCDP